MSSKNIEVYAVNGAIFGLSFTSIESTMKLLLLAMSIVYTGIMIFKLLTKKENENK